ncbi:hypothetical protein GGP41_001480 [Bipolaris sorokiniana]|uniref:Uncharacterized protein n=1 Tax=Cochliobolus sativus TaxID=45130 RepID=A0A8H5Z712_COCSA|nr:hypothetical protein GGP41_001480 [Bipolaris sorokiniana]
MCRNQHYERASAVPSHAQRQSLSTESYYLLRSSLLCNKDFRPILLTCDEWQTLYSPRVVKIHCNDVTTSPCIGPIPEPDRR